MPKSRVDRKKRFREFSKINKKFVKENYLKNLTYLYRDAKNNYSLTRPEVDFILLFMILNSGR